MWLRKRAADAPSSYYPIVIRQARYSGVYEGGLWLSIPRCSDIPEPALDEYLHGDDGDAVDFMVSPAALLIGRGDTPDLALKDMFARINRLERALR